jgi:prepilin-type N-terminal cleavage/methylation domain-containing protein
MKKHTAFTLIELLVVVAIIALLAAICSRPSHGREKTRGALRARAISSKSGLV